MIKFISASRERSAFNFLISGKYDKALKYFLKIKNSNPYKPGINYNLAVAELGLKNYRSAEQYLFSEVSKYGKSFTKLKLLGDLYYLWGKREEAFIYYSEASREAETEKDKKYLEIRIKNTADDSVFKNICISHDLFEKGNSFLSISNYNKALETFLKVTEYDKSNFNAYNNIGTILMNNVKDYKGAVINFKKALELSDFPLIRNNFNKAVDYLEKY